MIRIQVFRRAQLVAEATSKGASCFLGKDAGSLIVLQGWRVGRRQLEFALGEEGLFVRDCGGMAPLKVNGNEINQYGPLASNDTIELADYRIMAHALEDAPTRPAAAPLAELPHAAPPTRQPQAPQPQLSANPLERPEGIAMRGQLHRMLIAAMDLRRVNVARMADAELRSTVQKLIEELIDTDSAFESMREQRAAL